MSDSVALAKACQQSLRFQIEGLDCQNEVRQLKAAVGPLVGGEGMLAFDPKGGVMEVSLSGGRPEIEAIIAAVARTGMRVTSHTAQDSELLFDVEGLNCQNEVRQLKATVGSLVGVEKLSFDTKAGTMRVSPQDFATANDIESAVTSTGMRAKLRAGLAAAEGFPLEFKVRGLDCQNEVRALKAAVGPLFGGDHNLTFDTKTGIMRVAPTSAVSVLAIQNAVATTGMSAEVAGTTAQESPDTSAVMDAVCTSCSGDMVGTEALTTPVPILPGQAVFRIHGMDCGDEVAVLG